jgi:type IX secretion system PorP/SprF family membrane protein
MRLSVLLFCLSAATALHAQQTPLFAVYRDQWALLNPAALSNNYLLNNRSMSLSATWHVQWWNLPHSPRTQALAWEAVADERNSVFGAHVLNDQTGELGQTGVYARYAYRLKMGRRTTKALVIGLNVGAVQYRADLAGIDFPDPSTAPTERPRVLRPDVGVGVFYHHADRWYAGLSVPQAFGFRTDFTSDGDVFSVRRRAHFYAVTGGYWSTPWLGNETSFLEPSLWLKYVPGSPLNVDVNVRAQVSELVWAGTGLNAGFGTAVSAALHLEAGLFFGDQVRLGDGQLKTGFAFDLPLTQGLGRIFGGSGEVNVVYAWK